MKLTELLGEGKEILRRAGIDEWELDAWYLLEYAGSYAKDERFLHPDREVEPEHERHYRELLGERSRHVPLQHLTGVQDFMGFSFYVNEDVLIPRQDTEILVEEAIRYIRPGMRVLDLCTGSGCILFSVLKLVPGVSGTGADLSEKALRVAERNRNRLKVCSGLLQSDLFERVEGRYDCILSNPPYIPSDVVDTLMEEVRDHEPRLALDGREDGLYYYRKITEQSPEYLEPGGWLFFEIGYDQAEQVRLLMEKEFTGIRVVKDLSGHDRVVYGRLKT